MRRDKIEVYIHFIWTTRDRLPLIEEKHERVLHDCLARVALGHQCSVIALNGTSDHVHLLLGVPPTLTLSFLVQQLKGVSSHMANTELGFDGTFKWRGSYAAFSVSHYNVKKVATYIRHQKEHHNTGKLVARYEADL